MLNLFGRWIMFEGVEKDITVRQLATKSEAEVIWFNRIKQLLEMYELPLPSQLLENVLTKTKWKKMVNKANNSVVELQWQEDISSSSTLKYINPESLKVGRAHHVWSSVRNSVHDSRRAQLKLRLLLALIPSTAIVLCLTSLLLTQHVNYVRRARKPDNIS